MAIMIPISFEKLRSDLEITGLQSTVVSVRQQNVPATVVNGMTVIDDFLTSFYARSTMIAPLAEADIDIFVVLDPKYYHHYNGKNGAAAGLLDFTKRSRGRRINTMIGLFFGPYSNRLPSKLHIDRMVNWFDCQ